MHPIDTIIAEAGKYVDDGNVVDLIADSFPEVPINQILKVLAQRHYPQKIHLRIIWPRFISYMDYSGEQRQMRPQVGSLKDAIEWPEAFNFDHYYTHEQLYILPAMLKAGFQDISFRDGERDSFGPLTRLVYATKGPMHYIFMYG